MLKGFAITAFCLACLLVSTKPLMTGVRVTALTTGKSVVVRITDRGPAIRDRVLDLSMAAARDLGITDRGVTGIRTEVL